MKSASTKMKNGFAARHTPQQRRNIKQCTYAAESKQQCYRYDQTVIGGALLQQPFKKHSEQAAQSKYQPVNQKRLKYI